MGSFTFNLNTENEAPPSRPTRSLAVPSFNLTHREIFLVFLVVEHCLKMDTAKYDV